MLHRFTRQETIALSRVTSTIMSYPDCIIPATPENFGLNVLEASKHNQGKFIIRY